MGAFPFPLMDEDRHVRICVKIKITLKTVEFFPQFFNIPNRSQLFIPIQDLSDFLLRISGCRTAFKRIDYPSRHRMTGFLFHAGNLFGQRNADFRKSFRNFCRVSAFLEESVYLGGIQSPIENGGFSDLSMQHPGAAAEAIPQFNGQITADRIRPEEFPGTDLFSVFINPQTESHIPLSPVIHIFKNRRRMEPFSGCGLQSAFQVGTPFFPVMEIDVITPAVPAENESFFLAEKHVMRIVFAVSDSPIFQAGGNAQGHARFGQLDLIAVRNFGISVFPVQNQLAVGNFRFPLQNHFFRGEIPAFPHAGTVLRRCR